MDKKVYAFKNSGILDSSSGGAFPSLEEVLRDGHDKLIVYGAAFDSKMKVRHLRAENKEDTIKFRGSKYIESNISGINRKIEEDLKDENRTVLFTGTPCQVAGIKSYLKSRNIPLSNLYFIDILCHGTPSPRYWENYKSWLEKKHQSKLISYSFRDNGKISLNAEFEDGTKLNNTADLRLFFELFNSPKMLQERCFKCPFVCMKSKSDITIGDFWGIDKVLPDFPFKEGVSLIISNNEKGMMLVNKLKKQSSMNKYIYLEDCNNTEYLKYNPPLTHATYRTVKTDKFKKNEKKGWNYLYLRFLIRNLLVIIKRKIIH